MKPQPLMEPAEILAAQLSEYRQRCPGQAGLADDFLALLGDPADPFIRARLEGHFTGSAWVVSADGQRTLLTHHRKLDRWLQPGGHADGDRDLARVALKEAEEETGLPGLRLEDARIFDLDRHWIPARGDVPGHWHHDVRYVVRAGADERFVVGEESHALAWRRIDELVDDPRCDESMQRMASRWLAMQRDR
ncbi:NUDIX hydrolase [Pseudoxanthomonas suwonensis 11-1]|uniref:NUDIX hydrolase n=2 Tax=Pseudoxanthomonas suwonensis TaxID=314722 RepID=E6WTZ9_PSEUU|nr:NUDIX hydrolase [Pseudoxanthomonas suwonensis 11-1]